MLSKYFLIIALFVSQFCEAQNSTDAIYHPQDYKEQDQFKHFYKRREAVSKWQINQLKNGALLIRLHDSKLLIEALKKRGQNDLATQKEHEAFALNKNIVRAFTSQYKFSKVYFFYSHSSDTLLKGVRSGIFLDTNLNVDAGIKLEEKFYLIGEKDLIYSSSIGYVKEDTARFMRESGNASKEMAIVLKNKYGHQLKDPFPFCVEAKGSPSARVKEYFNYKGATIGVEIAKRNSGIKYLGYAAILNYNLKKYFEANSGYEVSDEDIKPFLY